MMKLVYIASPYAGDIEHNTAMAEKYCRHAIEQGVIPFAPHLLFTRFLDDLKPEERRLGCGMGLEMLEKADELWVYGPRISEGMAAEIEHAERLGVQTRYIPEIEMAEVQICGQAQKSADINEKLNDIANSLVDGALESVIKEFDLAELDDGGVYYEIGYAAIDGKLDALDESGVRFSYEKLTDVMDAHPDVDYTDIHNTGITVYFAEHVSGRILRHRNMQDDGGFTADEPPEHEIGMEMQ
jgi:hypothetical protein